MQLNTPRSQRLRILLVQDKPGAAACFKDQLESLGHRVVGLAKDSRQALEDVVKLKPDLVIVGLGLAAIDGIATARTIIANHPLPLILLVGHDAAEFVTRAREVGIMASLVTPAHATRLAATIDVARERYREFQAIKLETTDLDDALAIRNEIEQAKRVLMRCLKISESEAFRRLWRARVTPSGLRDLAEGIVRSERLLKEGQLVRSMKSVLTAIRRALKSPSSGSGANGRTRVNPSLERPRGPRGRTARDPRNRGRE